MLKPQKKVSHRQIKEDKLVKSYFEARNWAEENTKAVAYMVLIPVALVLLSFWWAGSRADNEARASAQLARIVPSYESGNVSQAIQGIPQQGVQGLQAIVDEYGSTPSGHVARLLYANALYAQGRFDDAREQYDNVDLNDGLLRASALAGVGACLEATGRHLEAAPYFERAAAKDDSGIQAPDYYHQAARNFARGGDREKALELYQRLKKEYPASPLARDVERFIGEYAS